MPFETSIHKAALIEDQHPLWIAHVVGYHAMIDVLHLGLVPDVSCD
jgi:hypothetical protein